MPFEYPAYSDRSLDGRVKLSDADREHIKKLHASGETIRSIWRMYEDKCSRRTIQFVLFPDRYKKLRDAVKKEKSWNKYYNKDSRREYMRTFRKKKREIFPNYSSKKEHFCQNCHVLITDRHYKTLFCLTCFKERRRNSIKKYRMKKREKINLQ